MSTNEEIAPAPAGPEARPTGEAISQPPVWPPATPFPELAAGPPPGRWKRLLRWEYTGVIIIALVTLAFHFVAINRPPTIVWDEKWYVGDARSIIAGAGDLRPEHPPLVKLFIVAGEFIFNGFEVPREDTGTTTRSSIGGNSSTDTVLAVSDASRLTTGMTLMVEAEQLYIQSVDTAANQVTVERGAGGCAVASHDSGRTIYVFTDNAFGWRFFPVIFGTMGIFLVFLICRRLKMSWKAAMLVTFLFAFENMTFLHAGLALLDVFMVTLMLAAVLLYLDGRYLPAGVFVALSAECKLAGALIIIAIFLHWAIYRRDDWPMVAGMLVTAAVSFVAFTAIFDFFIEGGFENPISRIYEMLNSTAVNKFSDPKLSISSRPWTWLYPQWFQLYYNSPNVPFIVYSYDPQYLSFISSTVQILIVPVMGYMVYKAVKGSPPAGLVLLWFFAVYVIWIPLDIVTDRVTFVFYFLPATPAVCIGLGMGLSDAWDALRARRAIKGRTTNWHRAGYAAIVFYLVLHLAIFVVFNPAIPTIIKTWLPPFTIGVSPSSSQTSSRLEGGIMAGSLRGSVEVPEISDLLDATVGRKSEDG
jgi:predicted membrane-bound dolichyl-phosphate-mannose-protein mannosyltransferase